MQGPAAPNTPASASYAAADQPQSYRRLSACGSVVICRIDHIRITRAHAATARPHRTRHLLQHRGGESAEHVRPRPTRTFSKESSAVSDSPRPTLAGITWLPRTGGGRRHRIRRPHLLRLHPTRRPRCPGASAIAAPNAARSSPTASSLTSTPPPLSSPTGKTAPRSLTTSPSVCRPANSSRADNRARSRLVERGAGAGWC